MVSLQFLDFSSKLETTEYTEAALDNMIETLGLLDDK